MTSSDASVEYTSPTPSQDEPNVPAIADQKLLDKIDQLFELNIGELVALPQVKIYLSFLKNCFVVDKCPATGAGGWRSVQVSLLPTTIHLPNRIISNETLLVERVQC